MSVSTSSLEYNQFTRVSTVYTAKDERTEIVGARQLQPVVYMAGSSLESRFEPVNPRSK